MFRFLITSLFLLFSSSLFALDFSGTYIGLFDTNKKLITGESGTGPTSGLNNIVELFKVDKRVLINVKHNKENNTVTIYIPTERAVFPDMPLDGDEFKGKDNKSGTHIIEGNFLDNQIIAIFKKYADSDNERIKYFKAELSPTDVLLREKLDELDEKEKYISSLNKDIDKLNKQKNKLESDVSKNKKNIKNLEKELDDTNKELVDTIIEKDNEIADLKDSQKKEVAKIKSDNKKKIDSINSENEATIAQLNEESENTETSLINTIEDMMAEPLKINPDFLLMRSQTNDECNLYTSPSDQASVITPLKKGTEVENLVIVGDNKDWSLVATGEIDNNLEGLLGYLITDCLGELGGMDGDTDSTSSASSNEKISITFPKWDSGQKNKKITIDAPGFVSIKGKINLESGITEVQLNGNVVDDVSTNGNFEAFYIAKSGDNDMLIKVIDKNNDIHELSFILSTK